MEIIERPLCKSQGQDYAASRQSAAIESQAHAELRNSPYPSLRRVSCEYHEGVLTLRGQVPSYFLKQIAQTVLLHRFEGIVVINNRLEVSYEGA